MFSFSFLWIFFPLARTVINGFPFKMQELLFMETFSRFSSLEQFSFNNILGYASELKCNEQGTGYLPTSGPKEVICPEPRRAGWAPYSVETPTRSSYKFKR